MSTVSLPVPASAAVFRLPSESSRWLTKPSSNSVRDGSPSSSGFPAGKDIYGWRGGAIRVAIVCGRRDGAVRIAENLHGSAPHVLRCKRLIRGYLAGSHRCWDAGDYYGDLKQVGAK